ncbi:hypothetical protein SAMN04488029_0337 [Reichenbachiella faecimaris]|uniref:Uncharacterized protein n=1 Tax=Reichenbachiella faecimaris TaxID=692418 RepID=A0A1W2G5P8_REIFA|nr:hypothetical protein [Reichenbachiella faecimaris]SMD31999.1 hypothetical protein SAMN04488029_0337 [Reichenbachiella faecimaris]
MLTTKTSLTQKIHISLLVMIFLFSVDALFAQDVSDSLTFIHFKTEQKVILTTGMLVEIKTNDHQKLVGEFTGGSTTALHLKQKNSTQKLAMANIKKITAYNEGSKDPITGTVRFVVSASSATSLLLGGGAAAGGIVTISSHAALGLGLMGVSVPLIYYGIKLHLMLKNADRDVIKMNKGWEVTASQR